MNRIADAYRTDPELVISIVGALAIVIICMTFIGLFAPTAVFLGGLLGITIVALTYTVGISIYARVTR